MMMNGMDAHTGSVSFTHLVKTSSYEDQFLQAIREAGIVFHGPVISDGKIHRFAPGGKGNPDGWYVFFGLAGAFGDWSQGIHELWSLKRNGSVPPHVEQVQAQIQQAQQQAEEERKRKQEEVSVKAVSSWETLSQTGQSSYLERKKVEALGIRFEGGTVVVPLRDTSGKLWSLQRIHPDGTKRFLSGGRKKGCFHLIGTPERESHLYVGEGYATGASIHKATGHPVAVAFDAGNLESVVKALGQAYPQTSLIIAGDNDQGKTNNVGRKTAEDVSQKYGCSVVFPTFKKTDTGPTDFNDLHVLEGLEEVKHQLNVASTSRSWPTPVPLNALKQDLLPVLTFSAAFIPEAYQDWLCDIAERMQCPLDYVAVGSLIVTASLIGAGCGIRPKAKDSWTVIPNLWGGIVGAPSTLKSPALKEILKPFEVLEKQAYEEYEIAYRSYQMDLEAHKAIQEAIRKDMGKAATRSDTFALEEAKERLRQLHPPEEPHCKRYLTNDTTIEKMHDLLSRNPRGLLLFRDELMGLLTQWEKQGHESDRSFYLEAWNGYGSKTTDRIGRGTIYTQNLCISLLGSTQPSKLLSYFQQTLSGLENDGLLQRFQLLVYPDEIKTWTLIDRTPNEDAQRRTMALMVKLAKLDFCAYGALRRDAAELPYFHLDSEAQEVFYEWLTDLEEKLRNPTDEPILIEHLAKYRKLMPSLALIFHLINLAAGKVPGPITVECVERAAVWCDYLESHARRIYQMASPSSYQAARNLARRIQGKELGTSFNLREIYRKQWSLLKEKDEVITACHILENKGWLRQEQIHKEGRLKTVYVINPQITQNGAS